jgi:hypothetical protein
MTIEQDKVRVFENTRILFRNFAGNEGQYNRAGDRNFCIPLDPAVAEEMEAEGWNVKALRSREPGDPDQPYIQVAVSYRNFPPRVNLVTQRGRTPLTEDMVEMCDWLDIAYSDIIIRPYTWSVGGRTGTKAYLKTMFIRVNEDYLEQKYADLPEVGASGQHALEAQGDYIDADVLYDHTGTRELGQ